MRYFSYRLSNQINLRISSQQNLLELAMTLQNTLYIIGDIHGCYNQLQMLHQFIQNDSQQREAPASIIFLGDLIDRGPNNKEAVGLVLEMMNEFKDSTLILGNHDEIFLKQITAQRTNILDLSHWVFNLGGHQTLVSYDDRHNDSTDEYDFNYANEDECQYVFNVIKAQYRPHLDLIKNARYYKQIGGFVFVHAGIVRDIPMKEQNEFELVWIREGFLDDKSVDGRLVIHGHTPILSGIPEVLPNRVGIDTCAFYTDVLTCMVLDPAKREMSFYQADQNSVNPNQILPDFIGNSQAAKSVFEDPFQFDKLPSIDVE